MNEYGFRGFGVGRKRNMQYPANDPASMTRREDTSGIHWPKHQGKNSWSEGIKGQGQRAEVGSKSLNDSDRGQENSEGQKVTVYLRADLVKEMKALKKKRQTPSISWLIQEAVTYYLNEKISKQ